MTYEERFNVNYQKGIEIFYDNYCFIYYEAYMGEMPKRLKRKEGAEKQGGRSL